MTRTITLVTAARAKGVELPGEWFGWVCPVCNEQVDKTTSYCNLGNRDNNYQRVDSVTTEYRYIGPDLTLPENLHHAFRFADAIAQIGYTQFRADVVWLISRGCFSATLDDGYSDHDAPERHLALVAACEAALGVGEGV